MGSNPTGRSKFGGFMKAITPREAKASSGICIPDVVIEVFNKLIETKLDRWTAIIGQEEIIEVLVQRGLKRNEIFEKHLLDVEPLYRNAGWVVEYDKPGYNEGYEATFTFTAR